MRGILEMRRRAIPPIDHSRSRRRARPRYERQRDSSQGGVYLSHCARIGCTAAPQMS
jgi:hypothetical protein